MSVLLLLFTFNNWGRLTIHFNCTLITLTLTATATVSAQGPPTRLAPRYGKSWIRHCMICFYQILQLRMDVTLTRTRWVVLRRLGTSQCWSTRLRSTMHQERLTPWRTWTYQPFSSGSIATTVLRVQVSCYSGTCVLRPPFGLNDLVVNDVVVNTGIY